MSKQPKPCPFCAAMGKQKRGSVRVIHATSHVWYVWCNACGAGSPNMPTRREAVEMHNRVKVAYGSLDVEDLYETSVEDSQ